MHHSYLSLPLDVEKFDLYLHYRLVVRPYNTDIWDVLEAAFCFATVL
jgi:hypothetical protein